MRLAYLDTFSGVSGDMLLGAFVQAGVSVDLLKTTLAQLNLGAALRIEEVDRSGIHAIKVHILVEGKPAEVAHVHGHHHHHDHEHHDHPHEHGQQHSHSHHSHDHDVRSLATIRHLIAHAQLPRPVEELALRTFTLLGEAEAKIHQVPLESIHFHEVGSVDAIADIVLAATAAHALGIEGWSCSPLNVGGGTVQCAHGRYPVPAPATAELLRGTPTYSSGIQSELVTPTGAALVCALGCTFGHAPLMKVTQIGYGAGTRNPQGFANVVRITIGESAEPLAPRETVQVMEVAVDDLNPQVLAYVTEQALKLGALDVMCTPVFMKKNRPGTLLTLLCDEAHLPSLEQLLLSETSTLGFRVHEERRVCLERSHVSVLTEWGEVRVKVGQRGGHIFNVAPEFDDCRSLAERHSIPVKRVLEAALLAYRRDHP